MMVPNQSKDVFRSWLSVADTPYLPYRLAVGWSGGADSTALLLSLKFSGHNVQAWHVDHGWRESSAREAKSLAERAAAWGVNFASASLLSDSDGCSEAAARAGRYTQFQRWGNQYDVTTLCLAHHRDDQAETVCMRLLQGAGPVGCRGMWCERQIGGLRIVRPLLHLSAHTLRQSLAVADIDWFEDPSNGDMRIWRNHIRYQLFPAMSKAGVAPDALFLRWQRQAEHVAFCLDAAADILLEMLTKTDHGIRLPWSIWKGSSAAVRARVLQKCMLQLLGDGITPGRRHIVMVEAWTNKSGRGGLDLSRCRLCRDQDYLHLRPVTAAFARENQV